MADMCTDNRFELIEEFKKKLIESTNIETSPEEMNVLDNILFRFWQMGWLDSIDRMLLVKESAKTLMHSVGDSVSAKAFRNAGRFIQNAIDGQAPEFEEIPSAEPNVPDTNVGELISKQQAIDSLDVLCQEHRYRIPGKRETYSPYNEAWQDALDKAEGIIGNLPSVQSERKKGKWINDKGLYKCSACMELWVHWWAVIVPLKRMKKMPYCPNCGSYNGGDEDE